MAEIIYIDERRTHLTRSELDAARARLRTEIEETEGAISMLEEMCGESYLFRDLGLVEQFRKRVASFPRDEAGDFTREFLEDYYRNGTLEYIDKTIN